MNKLLKDAIADAKAVRETALANAKVALEEAFAPKLQSMLSHKIKEEMEDDDMMEMEDEEEITMEMSSDEDEMKSEGEGGEPEVEDEVEDEVEADVEVSDEGSEEEASAEAEESEMSDDELEEILRELEGEEDEMAEGDYSEGEEEMEDMEEMSSKEKMKKGLYKEGDYSEGEEEMEMEADEEEIDLEEIIKALREEDEEAEVEVEDEEAELEEAYKVIKYLRSKLQEINLLNAKLLYVNKLFKADLTESKKVKIIETFDRVKNVREAKLVYATLAESMNTNTKKSKKTVTKRKSLKRGLTEGRASAPSKATKKPIIENTVYNRFSELINYNK